MSKRCKFGLHKWSGCACILCDKVRNWKHDWSVNCEKCSQCGKERSGVHEWLNGFCVKCKMPVKGWVLSTPSTIKESELFGNPLMQRVINLTNNGDYRGAFYIVLQLERSIETNDLLLFFKTRILIELDKFNEAASLIDKIDEKHPVLPVMNLRQKIAYHFSNKGVEYYNLRYRPRPTAPGACGDYGYGVYEDNLRHAREALHSISIARDLLPNDDNIKQVYIEMSKRANY